MVAVDQEPNELEKLLADVQRTIRDNELFIRSLKKEADDTVAADSDGEVDDGTEEYEEL